VEEVYFVDLLNGWISITILLCVEGKKDCRMTTGRSDKIVISWKSWGGTRTC